jgi:hypothetical protein
MLMLHVYVRVVYVGVLWVGRWSASGEHNNKTYKGVLAAHDAHAFLHLGLCEVIENGMMTPMRGS